jgi:hypothetical protein
MSNLKIANPVISNGILKFSVVVSTTSVTSADVDLYFDPLKIDWTSIGAATKINPPLFGFSDINYFEDLKDGHFRFVYANTNPNPTANGANLYDVEIK